MAGDAIYLNEDISATLLNHKAKNRILSKRLFPCKYYGPFIYRTSTEGHDFFFLVVVVFICLFNYIAFLKMALRLSEGYNMSR